MRWRGALLVMHLLEKQAVHGVASDLLPCLALENRLQQLTALCATMQGLVIFLTAGAP